MAIKLARSAAALIGNGSKEISTGSEMKWFEASPERPDEWMRPSGIHPGMGAARGKDAASD